MQSITIYVYNSILYYVYLYSKFCVWVRTANKGAYAFIFSSDRIHETFFSLKNLPLVTFCLYTIGTFIIIKYCKYGKVYNNFRHLVSIYY